MKKIVGEKWTLTVLVQWAVAIFINHTVLPLRRHVITYCMFSSFKTILTCLCIKGLLVAEIGPPLHTGCAETLSQSNSNECWKTKPTVLFLGKKMHSTVHLKLIREFSSVSLINQFCILQSLKMKFPLCAYINSSLFLSCSRRMVTQSRNFIIKAGSKFRGYPFYLFYLYCWSLRLALTYTECSLGRDPSMACMDRRNDYSVQ